MENSRLKRAKRFPLSVLALTALASASLGARFLTAWIALAARIEREVLEMTTILCLVVAVLSGALVCDLLWNHRFRLACGVYWNRRKQPHCPGCKGPLSARKTSDDGGANLYCVSCKEYLYLTSIQGKPLSLKDVVDSL